MATMKPKVRKGEDPRNGKRKSAADAVLASAGGRCAVDIVVHALGSYPGRRFCGAPALDDFVQPLPLQHLSSVDKRDAYQAILAEIERRRLELATLLGGGVHIAVCRGCAGNAEAGLAAATDLLAGAK